MFVSVDEISRFSFLNPPPKMHCSIAEESNYCPPTSKENNFGEAESTKAGLRNVQHIIEIWKEKKT